MFPESLICSLQASLEPLQALHGPYSIRAADLSKEYGHAFLGVENIIVSKKSESQ
jgi:hypothetical protein